MATVTGSFVRQDYSLFPNDPENNVFLKPSTWARIGNISSDQLYAHNAIEEGLCGYLHQMDVQESTKLQGDYEKIAIYEKNHPSIKSYSLIGTGVGIGAALLFLPAAVGVCAFMAVFSVPLGCATGGSIPYFNKSSELESKIEQDRFIRLCSKIHSIDDRVQHAEQEGVSREENIQLLVIRDYFNGKILSYQKLNMKNQTNVGCNINQVTLSTQS